MYLQAQSTELKRALRAVKPASDKAICPVLDRTVMVTVDDSGFAWLEATDMDSTVRIPLAIEPGADPGAVVLSLKPIMDACKGGLVTVEHADEWPTDGGCPLATIASQAGVARVQAFGFGDYPVTLPESARAEVLNSQNRCGVNGEALRMALTIALPHVSTDQTREKLRAVRVEFGRVRTSDALHWRTVVASDGHAMAATSISVDGIDVRAFSIQPPACEAIMADTSDTIRYAIVGAQVVFAGDSGLTVSCRAELGGRFVEWRQVVPEFAHASYSGNHVLRAEMDSKALRDLLKSAMPAYREADRDAGHIRGISNGTGPAFRLSYAGQHIDCTIGDPKAPRWASQIGATMSGGPGETIEAIGFNPSLLLSALEGVGKGESVTLAASTALDPAALVVPSQPESVRVIMPMRL